jgi:biotin operon repressor
MNSEQYKRNDFTIVQNSLITDSNLSDSEFRLLVAMQSYDWQDKETGERKGAVWPSMARLGKQLGVGRRAIFDRLQRLVKKGYLVPLRQGGGRRRPNIYRLKLCTTLHTLEETVQCDAPKVCSLTHEKCVAGCTRKIGMERDERKQTNLLNSSEKNETTASHNGTDDTQQHGAAASETATVRDTSLQQKRSKPQSYSPLEHELAQLCVLDLRTITAKHRGMLRNAAKTLAEAEATPEQVKAFGPFWKKQWQAQDGQPPRLDEVRNMWGRCRKEAELVPDPFAEPDPALKQRLHEAIREARERRQNGQGR